ncbi:hypothetical protein [Sphingomonas sp. GV3]|uniref:hypothetical protein n=1 Tax=Sphingomonas sp. GV3 TaxID=3040671 RepID=UPI00280AA62B|nr:hypothetical protein [Sphingomonas sp. GV3]
MSNGALGRRYDDGDDGAGRRGRDRRGSRLSRLPGRPARLALDLLAWAPMIGGRYETLSRATRFLAEIDPGSSASHRADYARARYLGNCLGEIDRFLSLLLDAVGDVSPSLQRQRNTARKIGLVAPDRIDLAADQRRLRALGRTRACLSYCRGRVCRPDDAAAQWMTAGWTDSHAPTLRRYAMGDRLHPSTSDLACVGAFYQGLADTLVAAVR